MMETSFSAAAAAVRNLQLTQTHCHVPIVVCHLCVFKKKNFLVRHRFLIINLVARGILAYIERYFRISMAIRKDER